MKIYQYMKSLGLQKVYFTQLFLRLAAMVLGIWAAFSFGRKDLCLIIVLVCIFSLFQEIALQKNRICMNSKKNILQKDFSFSQNCASVFSAFLLCILIPSYWISCLLILIFFILYEFLTSLSACNSKFQWLCFENQIDENVHTFMSDLNLESVYQRQCCIRIGVGIGVLVVSYFFDVLMFGIACVRFSSYSIIYHFSKNQYKYQNISDPRPFLQLLYMRIRKAVAFCSIFVPLFFPELWAIPILIIRILESIEQKSSLFSWYNIYKKEYK